MNQAPLQRVAEEAALARPYLRAGAERFAEHLRGWMTAVDDPERWLTSIHAADLYLAFACAEGDPAGLAEFERAVWTRVRPAILRLTQSRDEADEVAQLVRHKLFVAGPSESPKISSYAGYGPLVRWVRAVAVRTALNERRGAAGRVTLEEHLCQASLRADPEAHYIKARYRSDFREAFEQAIAGLPVADRNLLRLHTLDRLTLEELGRAEGVNKSTVSRRLEACRREIVKQTRRELSRRLALGPRELDSLLGFIDSQLELSLDRVLQPSAD